MNHLCIGSFAELIYTPSLTSTFSFLKHSWSPRLKELRNKCLNPYLLIKHNYFNPRNPSNFASSLPPSETPQKCIYTGKRVVKIDSRDLSSECIPTLERRELELYSTVTTPSPLHKAQHLFMKLSWEIKYSVQYRQGCMNRVKKNTEEMEILWNCWGH